MIPVDQTILDSKSGNCFPATLASLLEVPLEDIPNFCANDKINWFEAFSAWIYAYGYFPLYLAKKKGKTWKKTQREEWKHITNNCTVEASVDSPRFPGVCTHSVLFNKGKVLHDPHPDKTSMTCTLDDLLSIILFVTIDPARRMK